MTSQELSRTTALVTGASRGFGRGIAVALAQAGVQVVGIARDGARLEELRGQLGRSFTPAVADAADPVAAGHLLDEYRPRTLVLNAGASPLPRPLHQQTWQTFSRNRAGRRAGRRVRLGVLGLRRDRPGCRPGHVPARPPQRAGPGGSQHNRQQAQTRNRQSRMRQP
jgi:uncharacterized protein YbjT (DUF2867 family)